MRLQTLRVRCPGSDGGAWRRGASTVGARGAEGRRTWLRVAGLALLLTARGAPEAAAGDAVAPVGAFDRGLFWRVDRPGVAPSNHVFGTLHVDDPRATRFSTALREALGNARCFMPELRADAESARRFAAATRLPSGETLADLTGAASFDRIADRLARRYGVPTDDARRLRPWAAYLMLSQPPGAAGETVDEALIRLATEQRRNVLPLETVAGQIAALAAVPQASQLALLDGMARGHDAALAAIGALTAAYLAEDLAALRRIEESPARDEPALRQPLADWFEHLLDRRTARMLDAVSAPFAAGGTFVAVGALHLQGERGLLAGLRRGGWQVERVAG